jgi:hypothetical protein
MPAETAMNKDSFDVDRLSRYGPLCELNAQALRVTDPLVS